jgi:cell division protein FtsX
MQKMYLILKEIKGSFFITLVVFFAAALSVFFVCTFFVIGNNTNRYIQGKFASAIPPNMIKVSPKPSPDLGILSFMFKKHSGALLDEKGLKKILGIKGVKTVFPIMSSQIPMQAAISIFGLNYRTDLICIGVPYEYISDHITDSKAKKLWKNWKKGNELPMLLPNILLDAYNNSMAEPNGLPRISKEFAIGKQLQILFGKSSIKALPGFDTVKGRLAGSTDRVASICLVTPISAVRYYNERFLGKAHVEYMTVMVRAIDHTSFLKVSDQLKKMGFLVETEKSLSKEILSLKEAISFSIRIVSALVILLCIIAAAFSTIIAALDRLEYYRILRVLGASQLFIAVTIWIKYAIIGFLGAIFAFFVFSNASHYLKFIAVIPGFQIDFSISNAFYTQTLFWAMAIPVLSTIPALIHLFTKSMTED